MDGSRDANRNVQRAGGSVTAPDRPTAAVESATEIIRVGLWHCGSTVERAERIASDLAGAGLLRSVGEVAVLQAAEAESDTRWTLLVNLIEALDRCGVIFEDRSVIDAITAARNYVEDGVIPAVAGLVEAETPETPTCDVCDQPMARHRGSDGPCWPETPGED